jgi:hypothetical protein
MWMDWAISIAPGGRLLILALCGALLGGCLGAGKPGLRDLPAYDPERGSKNDALLYTDGDTAIRSVDGKKTAIGAGYWEDAGAGRFRFLPMGPGPRYKAEGRPVFRFDNVRHDSALLRPGRHSIGVMAMEVEYDEATGTLDLFDASEIVEVSFEARPNLPYRPYLYFPPGIKGKKFWVLVIEGTCPRTQGEWPWRLSRECFKESHVVGSSNPALVGKPMKELFEYWTW